MASVMLSILALFVVGTPIVAYLWETLNHLLAGHVEPRRLLLAIPVAVLFILLLRVVSRFASQAGPHPASK